MKHLKKFDIFEKQLSLFDQISFDEQVNDIKEILKPLRMNLNYKDTMRTVLNNFYKNLNLNPDYQYPLSLLFKTRKYPIEQRQDGYYSELLSSVPLVLTDDEKYDYLSKLDTNKYATSDLLTDFIVMTRRYNDFMAAEDKLQYLDSIKDDFIKEFDICFDRNSLQKYLGTIVETSKIGSEIENRLINVLKEGGVKILYQGGDGDPIDIKFGVDLIISVQGFILTVQVKPNYKNLMEALKNKYYRRINIFACPTSYGFKLVLNGNEFNISLNGKTQDGLIVNDFLKNFYNLK